MEENSLLDTIIFKKYKPIKIISKSKFYYAYLGKNINDKANVMIKCNIRNLKINTLENEAYLLYYLKGIGIPKIITFGRHRKFNILIEQLLGKSIVRLLFEHGKYLSMKDCCMFGLQALDRLEFIHSKLIIHRDIKPIKFLIDNKNKSLLYITDFLFAKKYMSSKTGKHIKYTNKNKWLGSTTFVSTNVQKGIEPSRRDDIESLFYVLLYLMRGSLPWQNISKDNLMIYNVNKCSKSEIICKGLPKETIYFLNYCRKLKFEQMPNYNYLRSLLFNILNYIKEKNDLHFYWIKNDLNKKYNKKRNNTFINLNNDINKIVNLDNILCENNNEKTKDLLNEFALDIFVDELYNFNKKSRAKSEKKKNNSSKSKLSISINDFFSFGEKKIGRINNKEKLAEENKNDDNIQKNNKKFKYINKKEMNNKKEKINNINKVNKKPSNNKKVVPKLLNLDDFWGGNSTCFISEPIVFNSLNQIKKGKNLNDNLEINFNNSQKPEKNRRIPIYFTETCL
jgi:serine/threonine protein kinase